MSLVVRRICLAAVFTVAVSSLAHAQATRTWVSGVGDDVNPCSRTAPCKTFAGAISKTAAGGEISVLDPGGFGAVTITKAITINGDGTLASIVSAGSAAVIVNAGPTDVVVLRNISFHGGNVGVNGVRMIAGRTLVVEHCTFTGFTTNDVDLALNSATAVDAFIRDSSLVGLATSPTTNGVSVNNSGAGRVDVNLENVTIKQMVNGVHTLVGFTNVSNSVIAGNTSFGFLAEGSSGLSAIRSTFTGNGTAAQANATSTLRFSDNDIYDNLTGFGCGGGTIASANNNRKFNNTGGGAACAPTVVINTQ